MYLTPSCLFFQVAPEAWELLTYIPPYGEKFEYSHSHFLYTNDIHRLEDIPPPHVSPTRKQEIFDVDDYKHVDERTDAVSIYVEKIIPHETNITGTFLYHLQGLSFRLYFLQLVSFF